MNRTEFVRCTPESVGISTEAVDRFVSRMDDGFTEMNSLMIMRHGKICAEGWWAPYAPGLRHTMMSQTKTFTGTAIAIAENEGLLSLDEKIADIFPEAVPENADEKLLRITIRDLLHMGSGMETTCRMDTDWISHFFRTPVVHEPGTAFFYNDSAVTVLPAIIRKRTGLHIREYLRTRLFDKIGIDTDNTTWFNVADGCAFGAGGLHCTTEDVLRLMKLYLDGGVWEGERILPEAYVRQATVKQAETAGADGLPADNCHGYGYLMWMGEDNFRAEGAFGQITVVDPARDMIISFTESAKVHSPASQDSMDRVNEFLREVDPDVDELPENPTASAALKKKMSALSLENPPFAPWGRFPHEGETYEVKGAGIHPENLFYTQLYESPATDFITGITSFSFEQTGPRLVTIHAQINGEEKKLAIPTDGSRRMEEIPEYYVSLVYLSGYWKDEKTFAVRFRWIETIFEKELSFCFEGSRCTVTESAVSGQFSDLGGPTQCELRRADGTL